MNLSNLQIIRYHFDRYGIYNKDFSTLRVEPNQHIVKMQYLLDNPSKYNALCFGSSRVGNIDTRKINNGYNYYNMTYSEGLPKEWLDDIKILIKHDVPIKQILIGLDEFSFRVDPQLHESEYMRKPYRENNFNTYISYLLKPPSSPVTDKKAMNIYDIYDSGRTIHPGVDERIESDVNAHITGEKFESGVRFRGERINQTLEELKELKEVADANNIELIVFVNPIHLLTYRATNLDEFDEFKHELTDITSYYDFSGLNDITSNNYYYYETSHYRPMVGDMIIHRIFNEPKDSSSTFGHWVTKDNVDEHIKKINQDLENQ
ncbi:MAG TPA: hypothetical protein OIL83_01030 [Veillonellaceae bacterium]|uniref:hypothetical protein n=1 Tax=Dialister hominis TaxID=2582419 RepID=UPI003AB35979|nr:hypothetical protein [Veillonellaceae bacterium]